MQVSEAVLAAMGQTNDTFCAELIGHGKADAVQAIYTEAARVLPPGAGIVEGRAAIQGFWRAAIEHFGFNAATLTTITAEMCGDGAVEIGLAELRMKSGGSVQGKYIVHWKQEGGAWKWDKDIWNTNS